MEKICSSYVVLLIRLHTIFWSSVCFLTSQTVSGDVEKKSGFLKAVGCSIMLASQQRRQVSNPDDDPCSMNQGTHTIYLPTLPSAYLDANMFAVYSSTMGPKLLQNYRK